jgi:hypothetical protein
MSRDNTSVLSVDPITDPRWSDFIDRHPDASIFHTQEWLQAIRDTYGYEPIAFTTSTGPELANAILFCQIKSWLTGRRLVSLPFSDHCQPLAEEQDMRAILSYLREQRKGEGQRYIELRPEAEHRFSGEYSGFAEKERFCLHKIDLRPDAKSIYSGFHDSCIRRKIKRSEREELTYESGRSEALLSKFRHLLLLTRRRHKLPPQPAAWFRNIVENLRDRVTIHVASKGDIPVASILTLQYRRKLVYKYGCSDGQFSSLGGTPLLFWKAIQQAKTEGIEEFDLGRSDLDEPGLIAFKGHLGAISTQLTYYRNPEPAINKTVEGASTSASTALSGGPSAWAREALVRLPDSILSGVGEVLYRHIG